MLKMPFNPGKIEKLPDLNDRITSLKMFKSYKFLEQPSDLNSADKTELDKIYEDLHSAQCADNYEECEVLISLLDREEEPKNITKIQKRLLVVYKKLAFKKYRNIFEQVSKDLEDRIKAGERNYISLELKIREIEVIAKLRFEG